ncbi:YpjP family protein [Mangrovibacillus cuniculi]|uniref:YpjP-like protein n=1 Tax=Mangrovibacillus cuniculi TaxID=2593652 RepID=A0A7S8HFN6_9BACI|nr:YpjP family protein [Mangrovibacillus cuniculi]QPC46625.1 hypothetical protein G8O30_06450 [Mangrovibacillus cuniculi]
MFHWLKKALVVSISIATFGLVSPSALLEDLNAVNAKDTENTKPVSLAEDLDISIENIESIETDLHNDFVALAMEKAEQQAHVKFGEKISPVIANEFTDVILPQIHRAIDETAKEFTPQEIAQLVITEKPAGGLGEKWFHIYNEKTNEDIIRFHVRRDHPPQEGYYFNFHYHTRSDNFQTHHDLGVIYWDTQTPPKWSTIV